MRTVVIESPYAGDVKAHVTYARRACVYSLEHNEAPFASHLLYAQPGILNDLLPEERRKGIEAGFQWGKFADATIVYADYGISEGMRQGILRAEQEKRPIEIRFIGRNPGFWERLFGAYPQSPTALNVLDTTSLHH